MAKMNCGIAVLFCCCVFISTINQVAYADKEATSEEVVEEEYRQSSAESMNGTSEELSLESHEAMTRGGEFKPKFTTATASTATNRQKRSYEFLLGLVNNNSKFQVTNTEDDIRIPRRDKIYSGDLGASELLLEMMVKIAAHPDQWEQVHNLLQKIDNDLKTSKKIISEMDKALAQQETQKKTDSTHENIEVNKNLENNDSIKYSIVEEHGNTTRRNKTKADNSQLQQTALRNEKKTNLNPKNVTNESLKTNQWSYGIVNEKAPNLSMDNNEDALTTRYPWNGQTKPAKSTYPRNFAYHRVTGNPLYHNNLNSNPKAYIAVSVIAPKPINARPMDDDMVLENELRELKPWTHNQNLKNMASIRSRWVIQSDKDKSAYTQ